MLRSRPSIDFHEKQRARRRLYSPLTFLVLLALIAVAGYNAWDMYQKSRRAEGALDGTREAYAALAEREGFLEARLEELGTEAGLEAEIRERFGVAKAGEEVIVVLSEEESDPLTPPREGLWAKIKSWFSGSSAEYVKGEE